MCYCFLKDYKKAKEYYVLSLNHRRKLGYRRGECDSLRDLGLVSKKMDSHKEAFDFFTQSLSIASEIHDGLLEAKILGDIGNLFYKIPNYEKAAEYNEYARTIFQAMDAFTYIAITSFNLARIYHMLGIDSKAKIRAQEAFEIWSEHKDLRAQKAQEFLLKMG